MLEKAHVGNGKDKDIYVTHKNLKFEIHIIHFI